ncbi:DUF1643 domain-containing protein [Gelidibacter japonicus]|uniref:DUF1643 domain-containing protein n=1 Tax=Gelidibacter japonicus TaxID=1962232 RepID=UPI003A92FE19
MNQKPIICIPENDPKIRYILGRKGFNNLLVIALNPSTATAVKHDGTTDNIDKIAAVNGYDGWVLFNLSPQRTQYPHLLDVEPNDTCFAENRNLMEAVVMNEEWGISNIWLAWGNNIIERNYLKEQAYSMLDRLQKYDLKYWHIKNTLKGHPYHPAKQPINRYIGPVATIRLLPLEIKAYFRSLKPLGLDRDFTIRTMKE